MNAIKIYIVVPIDDPNFVARHKEMFLECNSENRGVYFKEEMLDFGYTQANVKSEPKEINIVNSLNYDIAGYWVIPGLPANASKPYFALS